MKGNTLRPETGSLAHLRHVGLFLVWGPPSHGPRSEVFARELGIDVEFVYRTQRRGLLISPFKYGYQAAKTISLLLRRQPRVVFVQSPPSFAVMFVAVYCGLTGASFLVDAHSAAMQSAYWTRPRWLTALLARRAVATIVTNQRFADIIHRSGGRALVIRDIPTSFPGTPRQRTGTDFNVLVVNTFSADEPLREVIAAAREAPEATFHVTGDMSRASGRMAGNLPGNVRFTGFLPAQAYYELMASSDAVMCLTTRDDTMQRGACEALSMGRPIITSDWPLLRDYFRKGTVHVDGSPIGIRDGVRAMMRDHSRYEAEIASLQVEQRREWARALGSLVRLVDSSLARGADHGTMGGG
jgi:glycosyltransferase involved in cell wall biosynthesis